jgi:ABC-2 type transport system permease protein
MNSESNVVSSPVFARPAADPAPIPWWRLLYWSVRRELWENRSIYIAPLAVAPLALVGLVINAFHLPAQVRASAGAAPMKLHDTMQQPYDIVAALLMATTLIVAVVYSLDALYGERRDRSILFWKSLPVSDTITVLAKASIPILILPLIGFVVTVVLQLAMAVISSAILAASGLSVSAFWEQLSFGRMSFLLLYHLVAVHGLSWAPFFGWMLLVSAWARRAPFVWALLPPVAIGIVERIAFNTSHFGAMLGSRLSGSASVVTRAPGHMPTDPMTTHITAGRFLASPGFLIGVLLAALFLAAAVRLRRYQAPN